MQSTTDKVDDLKKLLEIKMVDVEIEKEKTDKLIEVVNKEKDDAQVEEEAANVQAEEVAKITADA
jgi:hypothetical protein